MRTKFLALLAVLALIATTIIGMASPAQALAKVKCDTDGTPTVSVGNYDPIVNHNQAASMHEHQFFGNKAWLGLTNPNAANYADLVGKANNCRKVLGLSYSADSAGYWIPTLRYKAGSPKAGQLIPAQQFTAYYRSFDFNTFGAGRAFPADTRLIGTKYNWSCGQFGGVAPQQTIPDCTGLSGKPGYTLTAHIDFPSCWNGVLPNHKPEDVGNTSDNANYAYTVRKVCPAGFPIKMTTLRETIQFPYVGNGTDVELSSDEHAGKTDGASLHADFWNTWMQKEFEQLILTCVTKKTSAYSTAKCDP
jgi:hypothetical protein